MGVEEEPAPTSNINHDSFELPKNPTKAAFLSAFIPGAGQIYNGKYLKAAGVITVQGLLIAQTKHNDKMMKRYKNKRGDDKEDPDYAFNDFMYKEYYGDRQSFIYWIGVSVFMSAMEAYVDAHLLNFKAKKNEINIKFTEDRVEVSVSF
jgi:hypothetical protein